MLHPQKARLAGVPHRSPHAAARDARRELGRLARPAGRFDASRYFRATGALRFHNVGMSAVRRLARTIVRAHRGEWTIDEALAFADDLIRDRHLEAKSVGIEALACYRRDFTPRLLPVWKRWLARNHSANWATTDGMCGSLIGPLVAAHPRLAPTLARWSRDSNLWVRRASVVGLIPLVRNGAALDQGYRAAKALHGDEEDLIQKAVGWMLREAGKSDPRRLERYLRANGPSIPRTTVRYAIERFPTATRRALLAATRSEGARP